MKYDVFVSYSRKDTKIVDGFVNRLEAEGVHVWIDRDGVESGDAFKRVIVNAIKESALFMFFSSVSSNNSPWTTKEVSIAVHYEKPIIPIRIDQTVYNEDIEFDFVNLRDYGLGPHKSVDDTPYGGGDGMLLRCEPVFAAIESVKEKDPSAKVILPTPAGDTWSQELAMEFASIGSSSAEKPAHFVILCPHYEGYDERIISLVDYQVCLGKFILTGGEIPTMAVVDSIVRLIPGVLGGETSAEIESFSDGDNYEYPQYTRPEEFRGMRVPEVLLSGNHGEIAKWRAENAPTEPHE